jgi:uncharacterized protein (DUF488 family)
MPDTLYTIGHSNHRTERLISLLSQHGVTAVCDVRSRPYSRYNPQFDREDLKSALEGNGIAYVFLGKELGARSDDPSCYLYGKVQYTKLAQTDLFQAGLQRVRDGMKKYTVALMCAEKEPLECHRTILVSRQLAESGLGIQHIHEDGRLESHAEALVRLAQSLKLREAEYHLFRSREDLFADAYALQEKRIGYDSAAEAATVSKALESAAG